MKSERWIKEHLERLREETADWPEWLKKPMKPAKRNVGNGRRRIKQEDAN